MKFVTFGGRDDSQVGIVRDERVVPIDIETEPRCRTHDAVDAILGTWHESPSVERIPIEDATVRPPVRTPGKIVGVGLNYHDHADEGGSEVPDEPRIFLKAPTSIAAPGSRIIYPHETDQLDYEGELAVVIGKPGRRIDAADAITHVAGFTAFNDVSARDIQYASAHIDRGKSFDTFGPIGPVLVTPDSLQYDDLAIRTTVNGERRQDSSTASMMYTVDELVEFVSASMTLRPGDVIATGTPPGVGVHREPPELLSPGDEVSVTVEAIGTLRNTVVDETEMNGPGTPR